MFMILSKKPKVIIDTNVFISGIIYGGNPEKVLRLFAQNRITLLISPETTEELVSKLYHFELEKDSIDDLLYLLNERATKVISKEKVKISRDKKDNIFLELANSGGADYLVTGDKDLLIIKQYKKTVILNPKDFFEMFE